MSYVPRNWHRAHKDSLSRGDKAADHLRNGMGSWKFVFSFVFFMIIWAFLNTVGTFHHWDKYPFILLNLFLSMLAGLQGAILLIAARRADGISAAMAQHDYDTNVEAKQEIERLMDINERQLKILEKLVEEHKLSRHITTSKNNHS
jgi:uncharacterized membrane protein